MDYLTWCFQLLPLLSLAVRSQSAGPATVAIDFGRTGTAFRHFWKSTGFCPPDPKEQIPEFFMTTAVALNLALMGSLPNNGIEQVRIHWLYNLLAARYQPGIVSYNYTSLDRLLDFMKRYNLRPGFEMMGYPNVTGDQIQRSPNPPANFTRLDWYSFTRDLVEHIIDRYGVTEVSEWNFETWNEPDLKHYNVLNFTSGDYLQYVLDSSEGLKEAFRKRNGTARGRLLGPAGLFRETGHPFCWGLLRYCHEHPDSCPIEYLSFHRKGNGTSRSLLEATEELLESLYEKLPNVRMLPIVNDESDIMRTWSRSLEWRGDARYAAMIVEVIAGYYGRLHLSRKLDVHLISNDNGFLNYHPFYFTQRTLFARFQMNNTDPRHDQFIKKPSYTVMGLLSQLGDEYLPANICPQDGGLTVLATRSMQNRQVLLTYANSSVMDSATAKMVEVRLENLGHVGPTTKVVVYVLDNVRTNPYQVWKDAGSPVFPPKELRRQMRQVEEPVRIAPTVAVSSNDVRLHLALTLPSIVLLKLCEKPARFDSSVTNVNIFNITRNEILITWRDVSRTVECIQTYEVEAESKCENSLEFKRVNLNDTVFLSYHHAPAGNGTCELTTGRYRVRVVDVWERPGNYSEIVTYPRATR